MNEPIQTPPTRVRPPAAAMVLIACAALVVTSGDNRAMGSAQSRTARLQRTWARPRRKTRKNHRRKTGRPSHHRTRRRACARGSLRRHRASTRTHHGKTRSRRNRSKGTRNSRGAAKQGIVRTRRTSRSRKRTRRHPSLQQAKRRLVSVTGPLPPAWSPEFATVIKKDQRRRQTGTPPVRFHGAQTRRDRCLALLRKHHVPFRRAGPHYGIAAPVVLTGRVGGILYKNKWKPSEPPLMDCLLALTLLRAAPVWKRHGVREVIFSNTYRRGRRGDPRPSRHALGLAMDVRDVEFDDGTVLNVERDWEKFYGRPKLCVGPVRSDKAARLRAIVCDMEAANVYRRILTPDSDHGHRDHFHMAAAKPGERWERERWAGRLLYQPLPGTKLFASWYHWYRCYRHLTWRGRKACWRKRRPHWVRSGNPHRFIPAGRPSYLPKVLGSSFHPANDRHSQYHASNASTLVSPSRVTAPATSQPTETASRTHRSEQNAARLTHGTHPKQSSVATK